MTSHAGLCRPRMPLSSMLALVFVLVLGLGAAPQAAQAAISEIEAGNSLAGPEGVLLPKGQAKAPMILAENKNWNKNWNNNKNWNKNWSNNKNWNNNKNWDKNNNWSKNWKYGNKKYKYNNRIYVRRWDRRPYYGQFFGGIVLGSILTAAAIGVAPPPPAPELCWYWIDPYQNRGYWDYCPPY